MTDTPYRPAPIRVGDGNPFADDTMARRVPENIREVQARNPDYSPSIMANLDALHDAIAGNSAISMIDPVGAPDYADWFRAYHGQREASPPMTWHSVVWFFAETLFYRHLMQAVRYFETGRDPYTPKKQDELASDALWTTLDRALSLPADADDRIAALLAFALWGNRIDLSFTASLSRGSEAGDDDLLVDDRAAAIAHLMTTPPGTIHLIADNTGTELATDLALVDGLLASGLAERVVIHVKMHPTFVSDAIPADVWALLAAMESRGGAAAALAGRLRAHWDTSRLVIAPHFFWNSPHFLWDIPTQLRVTFQGARLVLLKGDANYRRAVGDAVWPPTTPFATATQGFDAPLLALRTLKSDPVVGLQPDLAETLDAVDSEWRVNGQRGVIQFNGLVG